MEEYVSLGKYDSLRDEVLHALCVNDWANDSFGDIDWGAYYWRIHNDPADVQEANLEFRSVLETLGYEWSDSLAKSLTGSFLVVELSNGFVNVGEYSTEASLIKACELLEAGYNNWLNEGLEDE